MKFTYDSARRQKTSTDAVGREMEYFYDDRDRAIMVRYTDGSTERTLFGDDAGQTQNLVVARQDRDGTVTSYEYDDQGRLEKTITASHKIPTADVIDETKTDLGALLAGNEITDVNIKVERTCTYLGRHGFARVVYRPGRDDDVRIRLSAAADRTDRAAAERPDADQQDKVRRQSRVLARKIPTAARALTRTARAIAR